MKILADHKNDFRKIQGQINKEVSSNELITRVVKNTEDLPFFLGSNLNTPIVTIELDPISHPEGGIQRRRITINGWGELNSKGDIVYKYPNTTTQQFWCGLFQELSKLTDAEKVKGQVEWSRKDLLTNILDKANSGKNFETHDDHIKRLAGTVYRLENVYYDKELDDTLSMVNMFTLLEKLNLTEKRQSKNVVYDKCKATINTELIKNFLSGYYKPINLTVFSSINSSIARKLYSKLDTQFAYNINRFEMTTERFFRENGLFGTKYNHPANRKQNLELAVTALIGKKLSSGKYIKGYSFEKTATKKDWKIIVWAEHSNVVEISNVRASQKSPQKIIISEPSKVISPASPQSQQLSVASFPTPQEQFPSDVEVSVTAKASVKEPIEGQVKQFLTRFAELFSAADVTNLYRSRAVEKKVRAFIEEHGLNKSLEFLQYAKQKSNDPSYEKLTNAETPSYLFNSKLGGGLINLWLEERRLQLRLKEEEKAIKQRRKENERDTFRQEKQQEYEAYIEDLINGLNEVQQEAFSHFFSTKEEKYLADKNDFIKKNYHSSPHQTLKKQLKREAFVSFSQQLLPTPAKSFEEWVKEYYPTQYQAFYFEKTA